ncbi:MAG: PIN domain-containing protein [Candidatus Lutacidiplasmatales archaeon]
MSLTIHSYAWIELIKGTPLGVKVKGLMEAAESCYTPAIVLAEVAHKCLREGFEEGQIRRELRGIVESSALVPIDPDLVAVASLATRELRELARSRRLNPPGLGDGLVLATTRRTRARLLTGDAHFRELHETLWLN